MPKNIYLMGHIDGRPIYVDEGAKELHMRFDITRYPPIGETMANIGLKQAVKKLVFYSKKAGAIVGIPLEDFEKDIEETPGHLTVDDLVTQEHIRVETHGGVKVAYPTEKLLDDLEFPRSQKLTRT